ncbi:hypothetical protein J4219_01130 [Candidatus Woesearchaeota archaeon]|nr:hypothetical protein [Candidatus Woesearchaeota archaeon]
MDDSKKLEEVKVIIQAWLDKQGHDRCWYYPDLFRELAGLLDISASKEPGLPPLDEFKKGCERYQKEEFAMKK